MYFVLENYGQIGTMEKITAAADTPYSIAHDTYQITNKMIHVDSGGTYAVLAGDMIIGATSGATAIVTEVGAPEGATTWAGGDYAGWLYLYNVTGTWQNNEVMKLIKNIDAAEVADAATIDLTIRNADHKVLPEGQAKAAFITIETNGVRLAWDRNPVGSGGSGIAAYGIPLTAAQNIILKDHNLIRNLKMCNFTAGSNFVATIVCYF